MANQQKPFKLIREFNTFKEFDVYTEDVSKKGMNDKKQLKFEGPFLKADTKNKNKRVYPEETLTKAIEKYKDEKINQRCALGELGHPENIEINLDRVSHLVEEIKRSSNNENTWIGKAEVFEDVGAGKIAAGLIRRNVVLGVSSRGLGNLDESGDTYNVSDYHLVAIDIVADPSTPGAFVDGIMENKNYLLEETSNGSKFKEVEGAYNDLEQNIKTLNERNRKKVLRRAVRKFMDKISR